jgi:hypothetical protein
MPILNYTTEVPSERTVGEITALLIRKQARSITSEFDDAGELKSVSFLMPVGGVPVQFLLPANVEGVVRVLLKDAPWHHRRGVAQPAYEKKLRDRAKWIAWRILKDWVAAQIALIESGQVDAAQAFMPYAQQDDGLTLFQVFIESNQKRLSSGGTKP